MTDSKSTVPARIAPAGLMFLAITSVGWGFNWPVTKYLLSELPPLTLRGSTGVIGATLLAVLALARSQSLKVERHLWPRLMLAALLNVTGLGRGDRHHGGACHRRRGVRDRTRRAARSDADRGA